MSNEATTDPQTDEIRKALSDAQQRARALEESNAAMARELEGMHAQIVVHQDEATRATKAHAELREEQRGRSHVFEQATGRAAGLAAEVAGLRSDVEGRDVEIETWKRRHAAAIDERDGARATIAQLEADAASERRGAANAIEDIRGERDGARADWRALQDELELRNTELADERAAHRETKLKLGESMGATAGPVA